MENVYLYAETESVVFICFFEAYLEISYIVKMDDQAYVYLTNILAAASMVFAVIFITLPIPKRKGLKNYRMSLWFLFAAYTATSVIALVDKVLVNMLSMVFLTMCSMLILLTSIALINLLHPERVNRRFVLVNVFPVIGINIVYWAIAALLGNPILQSFDQIVGNMFRPQVVIRIIVWLLCIVQLIYFALLFREDVQLYDTRLDEYLSENYKLHLPWVKACFNGVFLLGLSALFTSLVSSPVVLMGFYTILTIFFVVFGACYIQYPRTYVKIEKVFQPEKITEEGKLSKRRYSWDNLRQQVLDEKYYMTQGVNIEDMAQFLQIGRTTLSGFINKEEGMNFSAWIGTLRVEEAIRIFREDSQYSIAEVSETVGYSEPSNFSRQFKSITGLSPSEWCRQENEQVLSQ